MERYHLEKSCVDGRIILYIPIELIKEWRSDVLGYHYHIA
jgi:hypothetical protein